MIKIEEKTFLLVGRKFRNALIGSKLKKYTETGASKHYTKQFSQMSFVYDYYSYPFHALWWKMAKHTLRFLHCLHRKILKVCLTIFHRYTQKGWRSVHSIKLRCDIHFSHVIAQCTIITFQHIPLDTIQFFWNSWYLKKKTFNWKLIKWKICWIIP